MTVTFVAVITSPGLVENESVTDGVPVKFVLLPVIVAWNEAPCNAWLGAMLVSTGVAGLAVNEPTMPPPA